MPASVVLYDADTSLRPLIRHAWAEVLGHNEFGDEDVFSSIGGTAPAEVKVMRLVSHAVGEKLPIYLLAHHPTVALLDKAVRQSLADDV
ncbi:hypothetical protein ACIOMM_36330 [Streptomyces sp. NPDC087908]|uniref:hypothetical protein n=1 Tax=Streptomyces sp. NPDC087908 TaxID=3365820 RepID=UPI0037F1290B